jgi:N-hydroxyarylamine O-acetyltransferase
VIPDIEAYSFVDLDAYFARVLYSGDCQPNHEVLEALHLAHATHIPFENLDILLGRRIRLDLDSLQAKLIRSARGGYCFEQNLLFAAVLEQLGFQVTRLAARVRRGATRLMPRTHTILKVDMEGIPWLADVGFGGEGLLKPLPLISGHVIRQYLWSYRVVEDMGLWVLQSLQGDLWHDLYAFTTERQFLVDFEMANHYVSTFPSSRFVQTLTVQLPTPEARYFLQGDQYRVERGLVTESQKIHGEDLLRALREIFGLNFPMGTRFQSQVPRLERLLCGE